LLRAGANPNAVGESGITPLSSASGLGYPKIVSQLIEAGSSLDDYKNCGALHQSSELGHLKIVSLLLKAGADPECKDKSNGMTPLHKAAAKGHSGVVSCLLEGGADIAALDNGQRTVLHLAAYGGHSEVTSQCRNLVR
jgi:ankyrin repeat protein